MSPIDWTVLVGYFVVTTVIGVLCMRLIKGQEDYFMGSRKFGRLLQTFAAFGAGTGAQEPVQVGSTMWTSGLSGIWSALMWLFVTPIYWITGVWYRRMRHLTLGDWFVERYESKGMGAAYALFAIVFYMFYLSAMFSAIGQVASAIMDVETVTLPWLNTVVGLEYVLVPIIAVFVILYGVLGGLKAAYWTDLLQGVFIILLSVLLIPYGLWALVKKFGDPETMNVWDGFSILHDRMSSEMFSLFGGPAAGEFPVEYIVSLTVLVLVGIVVQPHFIATGGGSAKTETHARVGLVSGNFLKRLCTVGWGLTGLIALVLLADSVTLADNPDEVWGEATKAILGPLGIGLVGLMLACLLAALMSSADCYMIVTSACVVRNGYAAYISPNASERTYVTLGRATGLLIIAGAAAVALWRMDVFEQFKLAVELPLLFAAPFWVGMWWRGANKGAAWLTILFVLLAFFIAPYAAPALFPDLRTSTAYTQTTPIVKTITTRPATEVDIARRAARIELWEDQRSSIMEIEDEQKRQQALKDLGEKPKPIAVGERYREENKRGGQAIFWRDGVRPVDGEHNYQIIERREEANRTVIVQQYAGPLEGRGSFKVGFLLYEWLGWDLQSAGKGTLQMLRLPPRLITPFVLVILLSFVMPRNRREALDRYYAKMKTPVLADPESDRAAVREAEQNIDDLRRRRNLLPGTGLEIQRPTAVDAIGFLAAVGICIGIVYLTMWLASIGA